jgi:group I intron endonuclease
MLDFFKNYHNFPRTSGIYKITTLHNGHFYIGSSLSLKKRMKDHRNALKNNIHHVLYMQKVYNKYGESNFVVEFIKIHPVIFKLNSVEHLSLLQEEEDFITNLCPKYNTHKTPTSQKNNSNSKKIYQYTKDGIFIKEWASAREVIRQLGIQPQNGLRNTGSCRSSGGYRWSYLKKDNLDVYISNSGCDMRTLCSVYDLFGKKLISFNSIQECVNYFNKIECSCSYQELRGYMYNSKAWLNKYRFALGDVLQLDNSINKSHRRGYIILQYDINHNFIKIWGNTELAQKELNLSAIYDNISGKTKQCGGFIWKKL